MSESYEAQQQCGGASTRDRHQDHVPQAAVCEEQSHTGQQLRMARESSGLSIQQVCTALRLKLAQVLALEQGDYDPAINHPAYLRGYIRNYCRLVKLCPVRTLATLPALPHLKTLPIARHRITLLPTKPLPARRWRKRAIILVCILLGFLRVYPFKIAISQRVLPTVFRPKAVLASVPASAMMGKTGRQRVTLPDNMIEQWRD